jgi:Domain of unknown function (DUF4234)
VTEPADASPEPTDASIPPPVDPASGAGAPPAMPAYGNAPAGYSAPPPGPVGQVRSTGTCILLTIVTLGIYSIFWYYNVHKEMNAHRNGQGLGGGLAVVLALFVGFVMPFLTSSEVGGMYEVRGQAKPVSGITGLWILLPFLGGIIWFVKTNGALNDYWKSLGAS